jgi:hypothetical protein
VNVPQTVAVELTISATVTITQEVLDGIREQYPDLWEAGKDDPEVIAKAMVYASVNPGLSYINDHEDIWDGVANMRGLIWGLELAE